MIKLVLKIIQEKRDLDLFKDPKDVVDVLLNDSSEHFTDELIADNVIDMMIPGEDSVPVLVSIAIKFLSECPLALQQLTVYMPYLEHHVIFSGLEASQVDLV